MLSLTKFFIFLLSFPSYASSTDLTHETLVFIRHGEKPLVEIGQLNCQGLNRSLKLPAVLLSKFGKPNHLFAPKPTDKMVGHYYIRPLATIEPLAIQTNMPVNLKFGYMDIKGIAEELLSLEHANNTIITAWEHITLVQIVRYIYAKAGHSPEEIPHWSNNDYDSIYVLKINRNPQRNNKFSVSFYQDTQDIQDLNNDCATVN